MGRAARTRAYLRELFGDRYISIGLIFNQGSFDAYNPAAPDGQLRTITLGPAPDGSNEHTLDQVRYHNYVLDIRTTPALARFWLNHSRPTRVYAETYPAPDTLVALGQFYDLVIHLHHLSAAHRLS